MRALVIDFSEHRARAEREAQERRAEIHRQLERVAREGREREADALHDADWGDINQPPGVSVATVLVGAMMVCGMLWQLWLSR